MLLQTKTKKHWKIWDEIKNETETISGKKPIMKRCMKNTDAFVYQMKYMKIQSIKDQNIDTEIQQMHKLLKKTKINTWSLLWQ